MDATRQSEPSAVTLSPPGAGSSAAGEETVTFEALDGTRLVGTFFEAGSERRGGLLINSGTGIPRRFYARFARRAAALGLATLTFDYRGIGDSAPPSLEGHGAKYRDWGQLDIPGAIDWLGSRVDGLPLVAVGHSTGGQQLGLAPNVDRIAAAVFVTVSTGYWRGMPTKLKWMSLALWKAYMPLASRVFGFAPAAKIGWGENLPSGVAREWGAWCLEPDYMAAYFDETGRRPTPDGAPFGATYFDRAAFPIRAYYFTDDPISTRANAPPMLSLYDRATIETRWVDPQELGIETIGHLGFFRSDQGAALWDEALTWLRA